MFLLSRFLFFIFCRKFVEACKYFISLQKLFLVNILYNRNKIVLNPEQHQEVGIVAFRFAYNSEIVHSVKKINSIQWSQTNKYWYLNKEDIRYFQEFLGHSSSKTTEIYIHVSENSFHKFVNPIDEIM